nr:RNA-directed DNA polymerase, eukaryota [Tanacetum cinerariifolium]
MAARFRSNVDHTRLISKSIFVTNFPDNTTSTDLWEVCQGYETVVDVYIPNRKSKAGKRFAFVRFIIVGNVDRLVGNLCTLWIGRMHLHANVVWFERSPIHSSHSTNPIRSDNTGALSFASALKDVAEVVYCSDDESVKGADENNVETNQIQPLNEKETSNDPFNIYDLLKKHDKGEDSNVFHKEQHIISDNFVALYRTWNPNKAKLLMISIYAPQSSTVRCMEDRMGSVFNVQGANEFNNFISNSGLISGMALILINGSPTSVFQFHCGLKQGDPLAPYLFILIMESLNLSFSRAVDAGIFMGMKIDSSLTIFHLFYADDAVFIGEQYNANLTGTSNDTITAAAQNLGCSVMKTPFKYLGVMVGGNSSTIKAWDDTIGKLKPRLSNWKLKTLSIGGRLTLLKSVLGSTPIYNISLYKVPKSMLHLMESIRRNFFNGIQGDERKITWVKLSKELFMWTPNCIVEKEVVYSSDNDSVQDADQSQNNDESGDDNDLISHCKIRVGNCMRTQFWNDIWVSVTLSLRRTVRGGVEAHQLDLIQNLIGPTILTNLEDIWVWDLNGEGVFRVKDLHNLLDESFLPKDSTAMRQVKSIPIKINVFAWKVYLDWLPTRLDLIRRGVQVPSLSCLVCNAAYEDMSHLLFSCDLANDVVRLVCHWWNLTWSPLGSYSEWLSWFNSIRSKFDQYPIIDADMLVMRPDICLQIESFGCLLPCK